MSFSCSITQGKQWEVHLRIFKHSWAALNPGYQAQKGKCWPPRLCASARAHFWSTDPAAKAHLYATTVAPSLAKPSTVINSKVKKKTNPLASVDFCTEIWSQPRSSSTGMKYYIYINEAETAFCRGWAVSQMPRLSWLRTPG